MQSKIEKTYPSWEAYFKALNPLYMWAQKSDPTSWIEELKHATEAGFVVLEPDEPLCAGRHMYFNDCSKGMQTHSSRHGTASKNVPYPIYRALNPGEARLHIGGRTKSSLLLGAAAHLKLV